jgi:hypothetical protein
MHVSPLRPIGSDARKIHRAGHDPVGEPNGDWKAVRSDHLPRFTPAFCQPNDGPDRPVRNSRVVIKVLTDRTCYVN